MNLVVFGHIPPTPTSHGFSGSATGNGDIELLRNYVLMKNGGLVFATRSCILSTIVVTTDCSIVIY